MQSNCIFVHFRIFLIEDMKYIGRILQKELKKSAKEYKLNAPADLFW